MTNAVDVACDWTIPAPPEGEYFDPKKTNDQVALDGAVEQLGKVPDAASCASREGWRYDDESDPSKVVACPATCRRIQSATNVQTNVLFGCETSQLLL